MKITRRQLRRLINEAINEHRIKPTLPGHIPAAHVEKIHSLIDGGSHAQAQSLIDGLGGDPNYARNYIAYGEVGDLEKLGNKAAGMYQQPPENPGFKPGYTRRDAQANHDLARSISRKYGRRKFPDGGLDAFDVEMKHYYDRYIPNVNKSSATYSDMFLEHRIKPEPASSMIPAEHLDKVHDLINAGELASAQSFVDAFGGDPDYVYNYIEYGRVGDIEKLGAKIQKAASGYPWGALKSAEDRKTIMDSEEEIHRRSEEIAQRHLDDYRSLDDIADQDEYTRMYNAIKSQTYRQSQPRSGLTKK